MAIFLNTFDYKKVCTYLDIKPIIRGWETSQERYQYFPFESMLGKKVTKRNNHLEYPEIGLISLMQKNREIGFCIYSSGDIFHESEINHFDPFQGMYFKFQDSIASNNISLPCCSIKMTVDFLNTTPRILRKDYIPNKTISEEELLQKLPSEIILSDKLLKKYPNYQVSLVKNK